MKERPILMSAPMVRAILAGTKMQTRRSLMRQPPANTVAVGTWHHPDPRDHFYAWAQDDGPDPDDFFNGGRIDEWDPLPCPYGMKGDRLWVRENGWQRPERTPKMMREGADTWAPYYFDADGLSEQEVEDFRRWGFKRRPSIHMPRAVCRLVLEVTAVRVERLQAISEADCVAEGIEPIANTGPRAGPNRFSIRHEGGWENFETALSAYRQLWVSINGAGSWNANPWCWAVEFRRVQP